jgi:GNAT superfamily N-acetyltransferase
MEIRKATENQILDCMFTIRESHKALIEKEQFSARQILPSFLQLGREQKEEALFYVAQGSIVVGTMTLISQTIDYYKNSSVNWNDRSSPFLMIKRVAVHPAWQRKGFGSELLAFAESYGRGAGYKSIKIEIPEGFKVLEDFYQACGFTNRGTHTLARSPYHVTLLEKKI